MSSCLFLQCYSEHTLTYCPICHTRNRERKLQAVKAACDATSKLPDTQELDLQLKGSIWWDFQQARLPIAPLWGNYYGPLQDIVT